MNLIKQVKLRLNKASSPSATTAVNGDTVDMQGCDGVLFVATIATANAGNYLKAQQSAAANMSDAADLAGSKVVAAADGEVVALDIFRPQERYVRPVVVRGAATIVGEIYAIQYDARMLPQDNNVTGAILATLLISPDEGAVS